MTALKEKWGLMYGELQQFKKGFFHLALQTGLPIVPMVTIGAHHAWDRGTLTIREVPITIRFLEPIDTSRWSEMNMGQHMKEVEDAFANALPPEQRPKEKKEEKLAA